MKHIIRPILLAGCCFGAIASMGEAPKRLGERTPLRPPFCQQFDDYAAGTEYDQFERFYQIINADGDKNPSGSDRSWGFYNYNGENNGRQYSKCAYLQYPLDVKRCDDWLIPWAIRLEAGKYYYVSVDASLFLDSGAHSFEIKMGEYNDAAGLDMTVVPPTDVTSIVPARSGGWFCPEFDGLYYMGIHGISDKTRSEGNYLFMDNISMEAGRSGLEPAEVTGVNFASFPDGTPGATVSFAAPSTSIDGSALSGKVTVKVERNGNLLKTLTLDPGAEASFEDAVPEAGTFTYSFTCSNSEGTGVEYQVNSYIGLTQPEAPVILSISEPELGKISLSWEAPVKDLNGAEIDPTSVRYNIYDITDTDFVLRKSLHESTEYTFDLNLAPGEQDVVMMAVTAVIGEDMESYRAYSDYVFAGDPYNLPYYNSFGSNDTGEFTIGAEADEGVAWRMLDEFSDPKPQDNDHGYISMIATQPGQYGELSTGKLKFAEGTSPFIRFYAYNYEGDENELSIIVYDYDTDSRTEVESFPLYTLPEVGWNEVRIPLTGFEGKTVRVIIGALVQTHGYVPLDNLLIDEMPGVDLSVSLADYSRQASAGEPFVVEAEVTNYGSETVSSFTATLLQNGEVIDTVKGGPLASFATKNVLLTGEFSAVSPDSSLFTVVVEADNDANPDNNTTAPFTIAFIAPLHPTATDLKATEETNGMVELKWTAPDLTKAAPESETEDFEAYPSFTTELKGFTMVDANKGFVASFSGENYPMSGTPQAYWTQRCEYPYDFVNTLGESSLFCMAEVNASRQPVVNDEWLISPLLYGGRQTVSFMAMSQTVQYGYETFEVYASDSDTSIDSFKKVIFETKVPQYWTEYFVSLPEGTKYFAIRCTSNDCLMFTLDNITYIPAGTPRPLEFKGYNIYANGERINDDPWLDTSFRIAKTSDEDSYFVTAVYDKGESVASNVVRLSEAGVGSIEVDNNASAIYYDLNGLRLDADRLVPGIYIRRQGNKAEKVIVR